MTRNQPGPRALIVVDVQNGFCHPDGSPRPAPVRPAA
jgi:nicotinamidase-related amidase